MIKIVKNEKVFDYFDSENLCSKRSLVNTNDYLSNIINLHDKRKNCERKTFNNDDKNDYSENYKNNKNFKLKEFQNNNEVVGISDHMKECKIGKIDGQKIVFNNKIDLSDEFEEKLRVEQYYKTKNKDLMNRMFS